MAKIDLNQYAPQIMEYGFHKFQVLLAATEADIAEMTEDANVKMKKPHRNLFIVKWKELKLEPRALLLLVSPNDVVAEFKKLKLEARTLKELAGQLAERLGISEPVLVCPAGSIEDAVPYGSLDEIGAKAKVSVWPIRQFDELASQSEPGWSPPCWPTSRLPARPPRLSMDTPG